MHRHFPISALLLCLLAAPGRAGEEPAKIKLEADVTYRKPDGGKELKLDIAYPDGKGPFPAVVCVHGGAWRFGRRQDLSRFTKVLAVSGYAAASISYRLLPDAKWPEPIEDCKTAVRFLRANAEKYGIDKDHIAALGHSAGGHLVCLLGAADSEAGFDGKEHADQSSKVQAVVSFFGPTDLSHYAKDETAQISTFGPLFGGRYKDKPEAHQKASPLTYVSKDDPPFLFVHGTKDRIVPIQQSRSMYGKLKEVGVKAEMIEIDGGGHGFFGAERAKAEASALKFLGEHLKK